MAKVLIIDDERSIRDTLQEILSFEGHHVDTAPEGIEGLRLFEENEYEAVLCDVKMPNIDGIEVLESILAMNPQVPVIMITGHGNVETAVKALKKGAFDFIEKPLDLNFLLITLQDALESSKNTEEGSYSTLRGVNARDIESNMIKNTLGDVEYVYDKKGKKKSAILPIKLWNMLADKLSSGKKNKDDQKEEKED